MLTGRRHTGCCAAQAPSSARPSNRCTDDDRTRHQQDHPRSRLQTGTGATTMRARTRIRQDNLKITRTIYQYHYAVPMTTRHNCKLPPFGLLKEEVAAQPGASKQLPAHLHSRPHSPDIGTYLNHLARTWRHLLLSRPTCSPLYEHYGALQYSATSANLLDVWPHGRNHGKLVSPIA
jgi:hypothetical protein